jgi:hypothetical protein
MLVRLRRVFTEDHGIIRPSARRFIAAGMRRPCRASLHRAVERCAPRRR